MTNTILPGTARSLQASATERGIFTILAIDHRDTLSALINPGAPDSVPGARLTEVKLDITRHLAPGTSAVLLDPVYGAPQAIEIQALPGRTGLLCALEEPGFFGDPYGRVTGLLNGWSVEKSKRLGADGVKLLLFYNPGAPRSSEKQEQLARAVLADCRRYDIPLFLEPMSFSIDPAAEKGNAEFAKRRRGIVVESVRRLGALSPDVLKVEFPVDAKYETDQSAWRDACAELDEASPVPWALLSGDEPFATLKQQLRIACEAGCSGFVVGRSVWREAATTEGAAREHFLADTARKRFAELVEIAEAFGKPWHARYALPVMDENWYTQY